MATKKKSPSKDIRKKTMKAAQVEIRFKRSLKNESDDFLKEQYVAVKEHADSYSDQVIASGVGKIVNNCGKSFLDVGDVELAVEISKPLARYTKYHTRLHKQLQKRGWTHLYTGFEYEWVKTPPKK